MAAPRLTTRDLVSNCDAFPSPDVDPTGHDEWMRGLYTFVWEDSEGAYPIGYLPLSVVEALRKTPVNITGPVHINPEARTVALFRQPATEQERTKLVAQLAAYWRQNKAFRLLKGWRNELWPVYGRKGELLFSMERAAVGLFGAARYGVHMTAFIRRSDDSSRYDFRIWVPKRAADKSTYPGMLDNTVAGGLMTNEDPFECVVREADEEASLPEDIMRKHAKETGTVTYIYVTDERSGGEPGYIYPECQWVYDLELPADGSVVPSPKDGEVESFSLHTVEEIQEQLAQGRWKPNCAMIMLDFFLRHGIYTPENEPYYEELRTRTHRFIPFPGPHWYYRAPQETRS
ncbi:Thiamin pyrophosphokinase-related protein [Madurella fahalii]|uniref:Thiamin pyrophosphokinase-related protein n=1 Tax=Madurella fahalii TaxID=1157608 RepID=A0ABQ0GMQ0_9PEZI